LNNPNYKKELEGKTFERLWSATVKQGGYTQVPRMLIQNPKQLDERLTSQHIAILVYLISRWSYGKNPFPSIEQMRKALRQGRDPLQRRIKELIDWQLLGKIKQRDPNNKKKFQSNRYDLRPLTKKLEEKIKSTDQYILREFESS
tara:strand:+ start:2350 stop:2784 length:435 start_codon:yes stop_codon:yes gene_type:complete